MTALETAIARALEARAWSSYDIQRWHDMGLSAAEQVDLTRFDLSHAGDGWNTALALAMEIADSITPLTDQLPEANRRAMGGVREGLKSGLYARIMRGLPHRKETSP